MADNEQSKNIETPAPQTKAELPHVESPPLSPAQDGKIEMKAEPAPAPAPEVKPEPAPFAAAPDIKPQTEKVASFIKMPQLKMPLHLPRLAISRRLRRTASLAATVMIAAGLGAAVGAAVNKKPAAPVVAQPDTSLIEENHAMQKSIARLTRELTTLKTSVESFSKDNRTQIAKIDKLNDKLADRDKAPEVTGSISKSPAVAALTPPPAPAQIEPTPMPLPRPAIVQGWTLREVQNGAAWVESHGDLYRVVPGIPLPGLGNVETIRRDGNQWVVVTSKGIITQGETSASNLPPRPRAYYPPYYRPY